MIHEEAEARALLHSLRLEASEVDQVISDAWDYARSHPGGTICLFRKFVERWLCEYSDRVLLESRRGRPKMLDEVMWQCRETVKRGVAG